MTLLRKIIFYILTLVYVICCPLMILYAIGYIFKPDTEKHIIETGDISLATLPAGAAVSMNNEQSKYKTPVVLDRLTPGTYNVSVSLNDYRLWKGSIKVKAGEAAVLEHIVLVPNKWTDDVILPDSFEKIVPVPKTPYFLIAKSPLLKDYYVYDYKQGTHKPLLKLGSDYAAFTVAGYFTVPGSAAVIFHVSEASQDKYLWSNVMGSPPKIQDLSEYLSEKFDRILWDPDDKSNIFIVRGNKVDHLDITNDKFHPDYMEGIKGCGIADKAFYMVTEKNEVIKTDYGKTIITKLLDDSEIGNTLFGSITSLTIRPLTKNVLLFLSDKGTLLSNHLPYMFVPAGVIGIKADEDTGRILFWQKDKIGIVDFSREVTGNTPFEKGPRVSRVYTTGTDISQAFWAHDGSHILFLDENSVFLLEITDYGISHLNNIVGVKEDSSIVYDDSTGMLYYLYAFGGALTVRDVIAYKNSVLPAGNNIETKD